MSNKGPKTLGELALNSHSAFGRLHREADRRGQLTSHLCRQLPADIAPGVNSCNLGADGVLTVFSNGPAWASRLRFEAEQILSICRAKEPSISSVKVRVSQNSCG